MPSKKVQQKFAKRGRRAAFARVAGVSRVTVSLWLRGDRPSSKLDRLAREWRPSLVDSASLSCSEDRTEAA